MNHPAAESFEPIAIIGLGCRLPGGCDSPVEFWKLLTEARDAVTPTPQSRWNHDKFYSPIKSQPAKTQSKWGGYVDGIEQFDPDLFGISPREAACMDPQQRMLLETAYRAIEDAGVPVESMAGSPVSVHVGISSFDYAIAGLSFRDRGVIGPYSNTGGSSSIAANRISYCFDLRGESVAVDTACSSSLVATHLACQSLQDPRNTMALAGGVNALLLPDFFVAFSQLGVLSPDGRCKTFDASANGYVRSEGAGMVLLKRYRDAIADGDPIYSVIRATALNQDGRTDGMTVPSQDAQQRLIDQTLQIAGIEASQISYVEAHGTGTPVGDPIEARAIASRYGRHDGQACHVGSVKTNIGHLEAGAGIASVIKVALAIKHGEIPAHLHLQNPNPQIDFERCGLTVPTATTTWDSEGPRIAGINGFGYGGANAHLIMSQHQPTDVGDETIRSGSRQDFRASSNRSKLLTSSATPAESVSDRCETLLLPISAHSKAALAQTAADWAMWLQQTNPSSSEQRRQIAKAAGTRRSHHDWRFTAVGSSTSDWINQLQQLAADPDTHAKQIHANVRRRGRDQTSEIAFICSGQGPQWWAMGRGMLEGNQVFQEVIRQCDQQFSRDVSWSVWEELSRDEATSRMQETSIAQPSIFALQVALAEVWKSAGIVPTVVVGHSVGEIAAAFLSGALSFDDACRVAVHRGRTMDAASSRGAMIAVGLSPDEVRPHLDGVEHLVSIAAINGPASLTISGCDETIEKLQQKLDTSGVFCRRLQVEYAFHSPQMDPVRDELLRSLADIQPQATHTPMISTVTGREMEGEDAGGEYWWKNVRQSVLFADAMDVLADRGMELAIEVGPHPVLAYSINECFGKHNQTIMSVPTLSRKQTDQERWLESIGELYRWGQPIDWNSLSNSEQNNPSPREGSGEARGRAHHEASPQPEEGRAFKTAHSQAGGGHSEQNNLSPREGPSEARGRAHCEASPQPGEGRAFKTAHSQAAAGHSEQNNPSPREGSSEARGRAHREASPQPAEGRAFKAARSQAGAWERDGLKLPPLAMIKQTLWSESPASRASRLLGSNHPTLGERIDGPQPTWEGRLDLRSQRALADHRVRNACVLPAAAMLELSAAATLRASESETVTLRNFRLENACLLDDDSPLRLQTCYDMNRRSVSISVASIDDNDWKLLCKADVSEATATAMLPSSVIPTDHDLYWDETVTPERLYKHCEALGLKYGKQFRGVTSATRFQNEALVQVDLGVLESEPNENSPAGAFGLSPQLLDSCFHGMIVADPDFDVRIRGLYLPQKMASIDFFASVGRHVSARVSILSKDDYRMVADIDLFDESQNHCVAIRGFESVCVSGTGSESKTSISELLYRYVWKTSDAEVSLAEPESLTNEKPRKCLVFADQKGFATRWLQTLPSEIQIITVTAGANFKNLSANQFAINPSSRSDLESLLNAVGDQVTDIAYLWAADVCENGQLNQQSINAANTLTSVAPLNLIQAWEAAYAGGQQSNVARLALVTWDAQPTNDTLDEIQIAAAPLIGFGRVIASESARVKTKLVDLSRHDNQDAESLSQELFQHQRDAEDELLYRDGQRHARRFVPSSSEPLHPAVATTLPNALCRGESASVGGLRYETRSQHDLKADEIEIEVLASGLNFSDVMKALALYPGLPDGPVVMGAECSGRITGVGPAVTDFEMGDEVIAIAPGAFASHVVVRQCLAARKPANISHAEAATIPIAFLTAEYALDHCARIRAGESVLIHSASGGVGIAAMQIAKRHGATVFATAGTTAKRDFVCEAGAELVMDSRSLDFVAQTLRHTSGEGVDVILNSLPGDAIRQGLSILKTGGRFLEIGKRDIYSDAPLGMEPFKNNLAMFAIDLDQLFREQPERMGKMLREMAMRFETGELNPLPVVAYSADETRNAFRVMQQGKHIGKVVVNYDAGLSEIFAGEYDEVMFKPDRSYWLAGGLGGFGMRVAQWLVDRGAKHLVLGGRSGKVDEHAQSVIDQWLAEGIRIHIVAVDLTSQESVVDAFQTIQQDCPPLAGVFHTAMILEDRLLVDLDHETLQRVLQPKVQGGWNLHAATVDSDLDQFVLFSSLSSVFGHAGQANYAAANAFLDSLAHYRRSIGKPASVINWGHVGEVGYLAERSDLSERLKRQGVLSFSADEAMRCLEQTLQTKTIQQSVLRMDWSLWRGLGITGEVPPRFAHLLRGERNETETQLTLASASELRLAKPESRLAMIKHVVGCKAATLLGTDENSMEWDRPLLSMGLDSLMAVEMRNWIEGHLEIDLPITELMRGEGLQQVCEVILGIVQRDADCPPGKIENGESSLRVDTAVPLPGTHGDRLSGNEVTPEDLLEQINEMSEDQVDAMLAQMMGNSTANEPAGG